MKRGSTVTSIWRVTARYMRASLLVYLRKIGLREIGYRKIRRHHIEKIGQNQSPARGHGDAIYRGLTIVPA
jgi:hypothetical protein